MPRIITHRNFGSTQARGAQITLVSWWRLIYQNLGTGAWGDPPFIYTHRFLQVGPVILKWWWPVT